jgi:hypothetical protein
MTDFTGFGRYQQTNYPYHERYIDLLEFIPELKRKLLGCRLLGREVRGELEKGEEGGWEGTLAEVILRTV